MPRTTIKNQKELRRLFWETFPDLDRKKITDYSGRGTMYRTDTRCAWVDWIDSLSRDNQISQRLAQTATLDG